MVQKTKIIHITQGFGGLFTYIKQIIQTIDREKFEIEILAPESVECREFCNQYAVKYMVVDLKRGLNPIKDLSGLFKIYMYLKNSNVDVVHVHSAKAGFLGRIGATLAKKKSIYTPHGISYLSFTGLKRMIFFLLEVFAKKFTYSVLACSESEKIRCLYEVGIPEEKIKVIPNAINVKEDLPKLRPISQRLNIGVVARLTYQKNPVLFVEIANEIKSLFPFATFSILGAGLHDHLKDEVLRYIEKYGLNDNFKIYEWGSFDSVEDYLRTLDIFLMPSVFEGLPFSLLEAINENVLCVTSKCDGCTDVINNNENGFSCMSIDDYVRSVKKAIMDPELAFRLKCQAKNDLQEKYNLDYYIKKLEYFYSTINIG